MIDQSTQSHGHANDPIYRMVQPITAVNTEAGAVTAWITVSDADETNDTLTTTSTSAAGTILIKHTNSTGSVTIATAGSGGGSVDATAGSRCCRIGSS